MGAGIAEVLVATVIFFGAHLTISSRPIRAFLIQMLGERPFMLVYSVIMLGLIVWLVSAYNRAPHVELWTDTNAARHAALLLMLPAAILFVGGFTAPNPTAAGTPVAIIDSENPGSGIFAITRHPMLWSFVLWALAHLLANGDAASLIFFGGLLILSLVGMAHIDKRRRAAGGETWRRLMATTSALPFAALLAGRNSWSAFRISWWRLAFGLGLYIFLIFLHGPVIGLSPLPV